MDEGSTACQHYNLHRNKKCEDLEDCAQTARDVEQLKKSQAFVDLINEMLIREKHGAVIFLHMLRTVL